MNNQVLISKLFKMSFKVKKGKTKIIEVPWTTGTTTSKDGLVCWSVGYGIPCTSSTTSGATIGVAVSAVTSATDIYTTQGNLKVRVPMDKNVEWEAAVTATLVVADLGLHCDLTDQNTISRASGTLDIVQISKFISTTKCWCKLNIGTGAVAGSL